MENLENLDRESGGLYIYDVSEFSRPFDRRSRLI